MAKKKRVPAIIFNNSDYKYPKGIKIRDEDELDLKLKSGDWNTGPVDAKKGPGWESKKNKGLSNSEKRAEIARLQSELEMDGLVDELDDTVLGGDSVDPVAVKAPVAKESSSKPLSHMNTTELMAEAENINLTVNEDWTKTDLYNAIKKVKG